MYNLIYIALRMKHKNKLIQNYINEYNNKILNYNVYINILENN